MGEGTQSARPEVLAARAEVAAARERLDEELLRLEASARAAIDVKAKVKRSPVKAAGAVAGAGFIVAGGPRRILRGARNAVFGKPEPLPKSMLPKEIDRALGALGDDGERVRGVIEREFATYLKERAPELRSRSLTGTAAKLLFAVGRPVAVRYGVKLANDVLGTDRAQFADQLAKASARK